MSYKLTPTAADNFDELKRFVNDQLLKISNQLNKPEQSSSTSTSTQIRALVESASDSNVFTDSDHAKLNGVEIAATADQSGSEIRAAVESASDSNAFTDADHSKLDGVENGATADQTAHEIKTAYESNSNTNAYTDADHTKLDGIENAATADQSSSEIKTAYESNSNTNAYTDAEKTKVSNSTTVTTGTWTPAFSVPAGTLSYSHQSGHWTKLGDILFISGKIQVSSYSLSGNAATLQITGLPQSMKSGHEGIFSFHYEGFSSLYAGLTGYADGSVINVREQNSTGTENVRLTSSSLVKFTGFYRV